MKNLKHIIHVNQHKIKSNRKTGEREPVITVKNYKENRYGHEAILRDNNGEIVAKVIYRPDNPLSCGATVWIETNKLSIDVIDKNAKMEMEDESN